MKAARLFRLQTAGEVKARIRGRDPSAAQKAIHTKLSHLTASPSIRPPPSSRGNKLKYINHKVIINRMVRRGEKKKQSKDPSVLKRGLSVVSRCFEAVRCVGLV